MLQNHKQSRSTMKQNMKKHVSHSNAAFRMLFDAVFHVHPWMAYLVHPGRFCCFQLFHVFHVFSCVFMLFRVHRNTVPSLVSSSGARDPGRWHGVLRAAGRRLLRAHLPAHQGPSPSICSPYSNDSTIMLMMMTNSPLRVSQSLRFYRGGSRWVPRYV